jgi:hypothetical protein
VAERKEIDMERGVRHNIMHRIKDYVSITAAIKTVKCFHCRTDVVIGI